MSSKQADARPAREEDWRERILADPGLVLDDRDLMRALIAANDWRMGGNIVDMRGVAMDRLEHRLDRLEGAHRSVIAAAYENVAGVNKIHRAILTLLDQDDRAAFLRALSDDVVPGLGIDQACLAIESPKATGSAAPRARKSGDVPTVAPGFVSRYVAGDRAGPHRKVTLRQVGEGGARVFGADARWIGSEALLTLDLGAGRLPGLLALGAENPRQFDPSQGTDLLAFFAGVVERLVRRWLA